MSSDFEGTREVCEYVFWEQAVRHKGKNEYLYVTSIMILSLRKVYKNLHNPCSSLHLRLSACRSWFLQGWPPEPGARVVGNTFWLRGFDSVTLILLIKKCSNLTPPYIYFFSSPQNLMWHSQVWPGELKSILHLINTHSSFGSPCSRVTSEGGLG